MTWQIFFWVLGLILFVLGAFWNPPRATLGWLGAAALTAGFLIPAVQTANP